MTLRLMMFVLFIFTTMQFQIWPDAWENNECQYMWTCYIAMSNLGVRAGGGVGDETAGYDVSDSRWISKQLFFDMTFFIVINIVLLNIVFGIIIDTFGSLREAKNEKYEDMSNVCFICNIDRNTFERSGINFNTHIKEEHHMWNYMKYIIHIRQKDKCEYNGVEQYVYDCLEANKIDWFPVNRSMSLDTDAEESEFKGKVDKIQKSFDEVEKELKNIRSQNITVRSQMEKSVSTMQDLLPEWDEIKITAQEIRDAK
eukprot:g2830.t1